MFLKLNEIDCSYEVRRGSQGRKQEKYEIGRVEECGSGST
jgi:hypothetical protein